MYIYIYIVGSDYVLFAGQGVAGVYCRREGQVVLRSNIPCHSLSRLRTWGSFPLQGLLPQWVMGVRIAPSENFFKDSCSKVLLGELTKCEHASCRVCLISGVSAEFARSFAACSNIRMDRRGDARVCRSHSCRRGAAKQNPHLPWNPKKTSTSASPAATLEKGGPTGFHVSYCLNS